MAADPPNAAPDDRALLQVRGYSRRHLAVAITVFAVSLVVLGLEASWSPFEADEADYVATSRYFGYLFLQRDVTRDEWDSNHWTRTQPPLTRYIVGAWLTAYGYDLETFESAVRLDGKQLRGQPTEGRVPTDEVLARARQPMVIHGAGAIALLYLLSVLLGGSTVGVLAAALALSSPFTRYTLVHVWAEAPLAFVLLLSALWATYGMQRVADGGPSSIRAAALGAALGLASATNLTGLVGVALTVVVAGAVACWLCWRRGRRPGSRRIVAGAAVAGAVALTVFVAMNPYLWRGPVAGLRGMIEERRDEMAFQQD